MGKKEAAFTVKGKLSSKALRVSEALSWADLKVDLKRDFAEIDSESEPLIAYGSSTSGGGDHGDVVSDEASYREMFSFVLGEMAASSREVVVSLVTAVEAKDIRERSERMADAPLSLAAARRESSLSGTGGMGSSSTRATPSGTPTAKEEKRAEVTPVTFMPGEGYVIYKPVMTWPTEEVSMCAWARFSVDGAKQGTLLSYASRKKDDEIVISRDAGGMLRGVIKGEIIEGKASVDDGQWHHICMTWSSISGDAKLYLDGLEAGSKAKHRIGAKIEPSGSFVVGEGQKGGPGKIQGGGTSFSGDAAEVSVWKRVLDRKEVLSMSKSNLGQGKSKAKGMVVLWDFKGATEDDGVVDRSDNDADGVIRGSVVVAKSPVLLRGGMPATPASAKSGGASAAATPGVVSQMSAKALRMVKGGGGRAVGKTPGGLLGGSASLVVWFCSTDSLHRGVMASYARSPVPPGKGKATGDQGKPGEVLVAVCGADPLQVTVGACPLITVPCDSSLADGCWHVVVVTWSSREGHVAVSVDGVERYSGNAAKSASLLAGADGGVFTVGQPTAECMGGLPNFGGFSGLLTEASLWSIALPADEARRLSGSRARPGDKGLAVAWDWKGDEGGLKRLSDSTGTEGATGASLEGTLEIQPIVSIAAGVEGRASFPRPDVGVRLKAISFPAARVGHPSRSLATVGKLGDGGDWSEVTVCAWVNLSGKGGEGAVFSYGGGPQGATFAISKLGSGAIVSVMGQEARTGKSIPSGEWHHVAITWRSKDGKTTLYIDGLRSWDGALSKGGAIASGGVLWVGQRHCKWASGLEKCEAEHKVPAEVVTGLIACSSVREAEDTLRGSEHLDSLRSMCKKVGGGTKVTEGATSGEMWEWVQGMCMSRGEGFEGQVAGFVMLERCLKKHDIVRVSNLDASPSTPHLLSLIDTSGCDPVSTSIPDLAPGGSPFFLGGGAVVPKEAQVQREGEPPLGSAVEEVDRVFCALQLIEEGKGYGKVAGKMGGFSPPSSALTVCMWVRTSETEGGEGALISYASKNEAREFVVWGPCDLKVAVKGQVVRTGACVAGGGWHHIAVSWEETTGFTKLWLDGRLFFEGKSGTRGMLECPGSLVIGEELGSVRGDFARERSFSGEVAHFCIFPTALKKDEVSGVRDCVFLPDSRRERTALYWDFEGSTDGGWPDRGPAGVSGECSGDGARLVALTGEYAPDLFPDKRSPGVQAPKGKGGRKSKAIRFKAGGGGHVTLQPWDTCPTEAITVCMWLRCEAGGTPFSYAALEKRKVRFECTYKSQQQPTFVDVDLNLRFEDLAFALKKKFGADVTFEASKGKPVDSQASLDEYREGLPTKKKSATSATDAAPIKVNIVPLAGGTKASSSQADSRPVDEFLAFDPHNLQVTVKNSPVDSNGRRVGLSDGSWHFLAVTWRSSDGLAEVIVDGLPRVTASNVRKGERLLQGGCLVIGQRQGAVGGSLRDGQGFAGCIAAVSIWDAALPIGRIRRVMAEGLTGAEPSLVLSWEFDKLVPGGAGVRNAVTKSKEGQGEGTFRGRNSIEIEDAWVPGDVLQVGLGVPASPKERIQVRIRQVALDASIISNATLPRLFLHVTFAGSGGDAVDETLRLGSFPIEKREGQIEVSHVRSLFIDELGNHRCRSMSLKKASGKDAEFIARLSLCAERETRGGTVSFDEVAHHDYDVMGLLDAQSDVEGIDVTLFTGQGLGGRREAAAIATIDIDALSALRSLLQKAPPPDLLAPARASHEHVHVSGVTRAQASEWGDSVPQTPVGGGGGGLKWGGGDKDGVSVDKGSAAAAVPMKATSTPTSAPGPTAMTTAGAGGKDRGNSPSTHAAGAAGAPAKPSISSKPADSGEEQDLPAEFVFVCTEGTMPAAKIRIDAETGKFQDLMAAVTAKFGPGKTVQYMTAGAGGVAVTLASAKQFEKACISIESEFLKKGGSGAGTLACRVVPMPTRTVGGLARSQGKDADDNPDEYTFICDAVELGGQFITSSQVKVFTKPDVKWPEFCEVMEARFKEKVLVSFRDKEKDAVVIVKGEEEFNRACNVIEDEWDNGGDGSITVTVSPVEKSKKRRGSEHALEWQQLRQGLSEGDALESDLLMAALLCEDVIEAWPDLHARVSASSDSAGCMTAQAVARLLNASCKTNVSGGGGDMGARVASCLRLCEGDAVPASPEGVVGIDVARFLGRFRLASTSQRDAVAAIGDARLQEGRSASLLSRPALIKDLAEAGPRPSATDFAESLITCCPKLSRAAVERISTHSPRGENWAELGGPAGMLGDLRVAALHGLSAGGKEAWARAICVSRAKLTKTFKPGTRIAYPDCLDALQEVLSGDKMGAQRAMWRSGGLFRVTDGKEWKTIEKAGKWKGRYMMSLDASRLMGSVAILTGRELESLWAARNAQAARRHIIASRSKTLRALADLEKKQGKPPTDKEAIAAIKTASSTGLSDEDAEAFAELAPLAAGGGRDIIGLLNGLVHADTHPQLSDGAPDENEDKIIEEVMGCALDVLRACRQSDPKGGGVLQREAFLQAMVSSGVPIASATKVADWASPFAESLAAYPEVIGTRLCVLTAPEAASIRHWRDPKVQESRSLLLSRGGDGIEAKIDMLLADATGEAGDATVPRSKAVSLLGEDNVTAACGKSTTVLIRELSSFSARWIYEPPASKMSFGGGLLERWHRLSEDMKKLDKAGTGIIEATAFEQCVVSCLAPVLGSAARPLALSADRDADGGFVDSQRFLRGIAVVTGAEQDALNLLGNTLMQGTLRACFTIQDDELGKMRTPPQVAAFSASKGSPPDLPACLASFQDALPHLSHGAAVDLVGAISGVFIPPFPARVSLEPLIPPRAGTSLPTPSTASQSGKPSAGAQALRRIALGGKLGGADTAISLLGGMPVSCSASPLSEPSRRAHPPPFFSPKADKKTISLVQFTFEGGGGVPGPGGGFVCEGRSVRVSLLDVFSMKFLGSVAQASLEKPKDGSRTASHSWIPTATGKAPLVSVADILVHPQLHLYFELCQASSRVPLAGSEASSSSSSGPTHMVSCGHALLPLKDLSRPTAGSIRELAVSGGTPFQPRPIKQGIAAAGGGAPTIKIRFEQVGKELEGAVERRELPPNTVCALQSAVPIAQFHFMSGAGSNGIDALFTRAGVPSDPVLSLFPRIAEIPEVMRHFNDAWATRFAKLPEKDRGNKEQLQKLLRECTLLVWPLMKLKIIRDKAAPHQNPGGHADSEGEYMRGAAASQGLTDMQGVMAGAAGDGKIVFAPFRIEEMCAPSS